MNVSYALARIKSFYMAMPAFENGVMFSIRHKS